MNGKLSSRRLGMLALVAVLAAGGVLIGFTSSARGQRLRTLTFKELDKGSTFTHVRNTKAKGSQAIAQGDLLAFTNPLANGSGKLVGTLHAACTATTGAKSFRHSTLTCVAVVVLSDGTLTVQLVTSPGTPTSNGAVTGGTGAYANARGVLVSKDAAGGTSDRITLAG